MEDAAAGQQATVRKNDTFLFVGDSDEIVWEIDTKRRAPWWKAPGCLWCAKPLVDQVGGRTRWTCSDACRSRVSDHRAEYRLLVQWVLCLLTGEPPPEQPFYKHGGEGVLRVLVEEARLSVISQAKNNGIWLSDTFFSPISIRAEACAWCAETLPPHTRGRRRRFCAKGAHRSAASRARRRWRGLVVTCVEQVMGLPTSLRAEVHSGQHVARGLLIYTVRRRRAVLLAQRKARLLPGPLLPNGLR